MKNTSRIVALLLILAMMFSLTACSIVVETNEKKYGYLAFPNTDWGMTKEECMEALGVDEDEFKIIDDVDDTLSAGLYGYETNVRYAGKLRTVQFYFFDGYFYKDHPPVLSEVKVVLQDKRYTLDDFDDICEEYEQRYEEKGIAYATGKKKAQIFDPEEHINITYGIYSSAKVKDLMENDKKLLEKILEDQTTLYKERFEKADPPLRPNDERVDSMVRSVYDSALSDVRIDYRDSRDTGDTAVLILYQGYAAAIVNIYEEEL